MNRHGTILGDNLDLIFNDAGSCSKYAEVARLSTGPILIISDNLRVSCCSTDDYLSIIELKLYNRGMGGRVRLL